MDSRLPTSNQLQRIPYLIIKISSLVTAAVIKQKIITGRRGDHNSKTNCIGAKTIDQVKQVRRVTKTFTHLSSLLISYHSCEVNITEWFFIHVFHSRHNHSCHPKEDDILSCHQNRSRIIIVDVFIFRPSYSMKNLNRPQPTAKPCIKNVFILSYIFNS